MNNKKIKTVGIKSFKGIWNIFPILLGVILLISMINNLVPKSFYEKIFTGDIIKDSFIGAGLGSALTGNPITGYILGKGFIDMGISLVAVTAFLAAWTTVGLVQFPAESLVLGKKFAFWRNISAFIMSILAAITTVLIYNFLG